MAQNSIYQEMRDQKQRPVLLILTGPTCAGKDTVIEKLLKLNPKLTRLITTTSRLRRAGEKDGKEYHFVSREDFEKKIANSEFLEWVEYLGNYKGGQKKHIEEALKSGKDVVWRIDVRGVKNIRSVINSLVEDAKSVVKRVIFIFLSSPDLETLRRRMQKRATENDLLQKTSLDLAKWEMDQFADSDYLVVNEDSKLEIAARKILDIMEAKRCEILRA